MTVARGQPAGTSVSFVRSFASDCWGMAASVGSWEWQTGASVGADCALAQVHQTAKQDKALRWRARSSSSERQIKDILSARALRPSK